MRWYWNDGGIEKRRCPACGKERPLDWFLGEYGLCWKCRDGRCEPERFAVEDALVGPSVVAAQSAEEPR